MERAVCEQCGHWQPRDWAAGDLCVACGASVRREVRCAWCAEWIPVGRFCRTCGCEVVRPEQYGPARMLKSAGVDRFSLAQRLRELDPEQAGNLARIYNAQLAVVARRVEELRLCESCLLQKGFSKRLEEELVPQLPMEKEPLAALAAGPAGPLDARPEALPEIAQRSPLVIARTLASIALLRMGYFEGTFAAACQALGSDDSELALEAALAFAHWRVRLYPWRLWRSDHSALGIEWRRLAEVAGAVLDGSPLRPWAAAAVTLALCGAYGVAPEPGEEQAPDWLRTELRAGLSSRDPDLRFTCAMALGEDQIVARALDSADAQQRIVARRFLARNNSPAIAPLLIEGPHEIRAEILANLREPLPDALVELVLRAVEQGDQAIREDGVRLLLASLTEPIVERIVRLAQREGDLKVFEMLLRSERLPAAQKVVRAIIKAGLFETLRGPLVRSPEHVDFADEAVSQLAAKGDPAALKQLIAIADGQLDKLAGDEPASGPQHGAGVARVLARIAFGSGPAEIRWSAYRVLDRCDQRQWDWLSPSGIQELFGNPAGLLTATLPLLEEGKSDPICGKLLEKLSGRWAEMGGAFMADRAVLDDFIGALRPLASPQFRGETQHQAQAARLLVALAVSCPSAALPALAALLHDYGSEWECRDVAGDLLAEYDVLARRIGRQASLAAELADALVTMLGNTALQHRYIPAIQLLARLAQDHAGLRKEIAARTASILTNRDRGDRDLKLPLDNLANAVEFKEESEGQVQEEHQESSLPPEVLDNLVILPEAPLKTLAQYVAFMKAMGTAADPMATMASHGMTQDSFVECMSLWGEVLGSNDEIALRYSRLMTPEVRW